MDNFNTVEHDLAQKKIFWSRLKRKILKHVLLVRLAILSLFLLILVGISLLGIKAVINSKIGDYLKLAHDFISPETSTLTVTGGRINVLIMGKGGAGHDAPDLTDTMMLASISPVGKNMTLISIPRDIWMDDLKAKINTAYYYGKQKDPNGGGLILAKSTVEQVLGVQIDHAVVIDFNAFKDVIDTLGGIEVNVKTTFTDSQYPIAGKEDDNCGGDPTLSCRYITVTFNAGPQTMDGNTALIFVRSRHGNNDEGDDIHREARQQLVIAAIVKKALTPQTLTNFTKDQALVQVVMKNTETDLTLDEEVALGRYIVDARSNLKPYEIPQDLLITPPPTAKYLNQFVFIPKKGLTNWSDVKSWVQTVLP